MILLFDQKILIQWKTLNRTTSLPAASFMSKQDRPFVQATVQSSIPVIDLLTVNQTTQVHDTQNRNATPQQIDIISQPKNCNLSLVSAVDSHPTKHYPAFLSKQFIPMFLKSGCELTKLFLDIIHCYTLLWSLRIEHDDISESNLMVDQLTGCGVFSDFDLATAGYRIYPLNGTRCTGTLSFMALDHRLLFQDGGCFKPIPRLYRHALESLSWVWIWICNYQGNGESLRFHFFHDYLTSVYTPSLTEKPKDQVHTLASYLELVESYDKAFGEIPKHHSLVKYWVDFASTHYATLSEGWRFTEPDSITILGKVLAIISEM